MNFYKHQKINLWILLYFFTITTHLFAENSEVPEKLELGKELPVKESFKEKYKLETMATPMISSNPNFGTSIGATVMTLFDIDKSNEKIPTSTLMLSASYSDRKSHYLGAFGSIFPDENWRIKTGYANFRVKSELDISGYDEKVKYTTDVNVLFAEGQHKIADNFYAGLRALVKHKQFSGDNEEGKDFLEGSGAEDGLSLGIGPVISYDTRDNQFYPTLGSFAVLSWLFNAEALGNETDYHIIEGFFNHYKELKTDHILAARIYGRFTPDDTPFTDLSTLGKKSDLRGYVAGEETANNIITAQLEYRWHFKPRWAIVGFVGESALFDNGDLNSDSLFTAVGGGIRYMVSEERKMHFRIDYAVGQGNSDGLYIGFGEAF